MEFTTQPTAEAQDFRLFLQEELLRRCRKNPQYSVRAFAKALGCDFSTLAKILRGQRPVGRITIRKFGAKLGLGPDQIQAFTDRQGSPRRQFPGAGDAANRDETPANYQQLTLDAFTIIAE